MASTGGTSTPAADGGDRRPRLARDLALSGGLAWVLAKAVKGLSERRGRSPCSMGSSSAVDTGLGYPSGHVAVAAVASISPTPGGLGAMEPPWSPPSWPSGC